MLVFMAAIEELFYCDAAIEELFYCGGRRQPQQGHTSQNLGAIEALLYDACRKFAKTFHAEYVSNDDFLDAEVKPRSPGHQICVQIHCKSTRSKDMN